MPRKKLQANHSRLTAAPRAPRSAVSDWLNLSPGSQNATSPRFAAAQTASAACTAASHRLLALRE